MKKLLIALAAIAVLGSASAVQAAPPGHLSFDVALRSIQLRAGVTVNLHAEVFLNLRRPCNPEPVLAVHGMSQTAATWEPLITTMMKDRLAQRRPCSAVALDLPGHGASVLPPGIPLGLLTMEDYAAAVMGAMDRLRHFGLAPRTLVGSSLGGLVVQIAQSALVGQGTSLHRRFGVDHVVLLASAIPTAWPSFDNNPLVQLLPAFADPATGILDVPFVALPIPGFPVPVPPWHLMLFARAAFFADPATQPLFPPGTPDAAQIVAKGYHALESATAAGQLASPAWRSFVASGMSGIFGAHNRTTLRLVTYEQDPLMTLPEVQGLYAHLTGDGSFAGVVFLAGPNVVHNTHMTDPVRLLQGTGGIVR